jgi:hypothetical protein
VSRRIAATGQFFRLGLKPLPIEAEKTMAEILYGII